MKQIRSIFSALIVASMFLILLAIPPSGLNVVNAKAGDGSPQGVNAAYVLAPTSYAPSGTTYDTTPTYKWKAMNGATKYQVLVYKGSTLVVNNTYFSSACSGTYCYGTPSGPLSFAGHTWKVKAYYGAVSTWSTYSSPRSFTVAPVPAPVTVGPNNYSWDTTPFYKWVPVSGATKYQLLVYRGTNLVVNNTYTSSVCDSSFCSGTPSTALSLGTYTWKMKAYNGTIGTWSGYSITRTFTVTAGFYSSFSSNAAGWIPAIYGPWSQTTTNPGYFQTIGMVNAYSSAAYNGTYSKLDYQVKMKRGGCSYCENFIYVRGIPTPLETSKKYWYKGYRFQFTNSGTFSVYKDNILVHLYLKAPTSSSYILPNDWNTLRVIASGTSLTFYINSHLVWSGTDTSFTSGKVGIGMYRTNTTGNYLYVDYATLATTFPTAASEQMEP